MRGGEEKKRKNGNVRERLTELDSPGRNGGDRVHSIWEGGEKVDASNSIGV